MTPTPLSREEQLLIEIQNIEYAGQPLKNLVSSKHVKLLAKLFDDTLKAFADEVERDVIGEDEPPCWAHDSRDDGEDYAGVDGIEIAKHKHYPCGTNEDVEQINIRKDQMRTALKDLLEKWGI